MEASHSYRTQKTQIGLDPEVGPEEFGPVLGSLSALVLGLVLSLL